MSFRGRFGSFRRVGSSRGVWAYPTSSVSLCPRLPLSRLPMSPFLSVLYSRLPLFPSSAVPASLCHRLPLSPSSSVPSPSVPVSHCPRLPLSTSSSVPVPLCIRPPRPPRHVQPAAVVLFPASHDDRRKLTRKFSDRFFL